MQDKRQGRRANADQGLGHHLLGGSRAMTKLVCSGGVPGGQPPPGARLRRQLFVVTVQP